MPDQYVADRDTVIALGHLSWKQKSIGQSASVRMAHVWTFARGKATTFEQLIDTVKVRELSG